MKTENKIGIGALVVAVVSLLISGISTIKSCKSDRKLAETNYKLSSVEYRPRIEFFNPSVYSIILNSNSVPLKRSSDINDSIGDLTGTLTLKIKVNYTNVGNSSAKILAFIIADTISDNMILKQKLDILNPDTKSDTDKIKLPHSYIDVAISDTTYIDFEHTVQYLSGNVFIIHLLALYVNELNQLYDTYYWINFTSKDIIFENPFFSEDSYNRFIQNFGKELMKSIKYTDENNYSSVYTKDKGSELIKLYLEY